MAVPTVAVSAGGAVDDGAATEEAVGLDARGHDLPPAGQPAPDAVVLMCHGGWPRGGMRVRWWYPPVLQNRLLARALVRRLAAQGLQVEAVQVRNQVRGWNEPALPAVADARRAVDEVRRRRPDVPLVLLGYSMGGRVVSRLAAEVDCVGVVALAPWWPEDEVCLVGTPTVVVHGARDLLTPTWTSDRTARWLAARGTPVRRQVVARSGHYMLRRRRTWQRLTAEAVQHLLTTDH